mgnify:CR=1 FL=1
MILWEKNAIPVGHVFCCGRCRRAAGGDGRRSVATRVARRGGYVRPGSGGDVVGCSRADFELSGNEFRRLLDRGELTLSTQVGDSGRHAKCAEGSSITVNLRITPN